MAASESFGFAACNFFKKETPAKTFFWEFPKIFKNIFSFDRVPPDGSPLVFICEFWEVFQDTSFIEHLQETKNFNHQIK